MQPVLPAPAPAAIAPSAPKTENPSPNLSGSSRSVPAGKIGSAIGPSPAPSNSKVDAGKPLLPTTKGTAEHKHSVGKPAVRGSNASPLLPTPPKFETNGKIPPFGSPLVGSAKSSATSPDHKHEHQPNPSTRLPSNSLPATKPARKDRNDDHDHDRDHHHASDHHDHDHDHHGHHDHGHGHYHSHHYGHSHGYRRSSGLSWLIIGGSLFGPRSYGYGYGYGPDYYGPGYVYTAPTEVYVPTTVVSPTVSIGSFPVGGVAPPQNQQMTPDEFAALPPQRQRELLLQALNALEEDFARSPNGEDWSRHLQLATIAKLVTDGDQAPDATTRARLRSIVQLFDEVAANADYKAVSDLMSFRVLHAGLHEFAAEEIDRSRRQLSMNAAGLSKSLESWSSGERWRDYLQLGWLTGTNEEMQIDLEARLVRFEKLLEKFDRVKSDNQFQAVTQPREFGLTHESLQRFTGHLRNLVDEVRKDAQQQPEGELVLPAVPQ